jgi:hypothetical protein
MLRRISIAELQSAGTRIAPHEAVAIAQQLINHAPHSGPRAVPVDAPYGPPDPTNVYLAADGTVSCVGCEAAPAISEIAVLLQSLLPDGTPNVPGSLRYTVARALLEVDAPPFDTLAEFSRALGRFERGARDEVVAGLFGRCAAPAMDRRRADPAFAALRRELRDADARVYDQQRAIDALAAMTTPRPSRPARGFALALGLAAGIVVTGAGSMLNRSSEPAPAATATRQEAPPASAPRSADVSVSTAQPESVDDRPAAAASAKPAVKRTSRVSPQPRDTSRTRRERFRWLRTRIAFRSDPL